MAMKILYEDKHLLCLVKPQGVPCQSDKTNDPDLMSEALEHLRIKQQSPYIGLVHRLDRPVGGVILFSKTEFMNRELSKQIQQRQTTKEYLVVVCGKPEAEHACLEDYLKKLRTVNMSKVTTKEDKQGKLAKLEYITLSSIETEAYETLTLQKIKLLTGRHHQIRVQLSQAGLPIWGDNKYNREFVKKKEFTQIALWSQKFGFVNPISKKFMEFTDTPDSYPFDLFAMGGSLDEDNCTDPHRLSY